MQQLDVGLLPQSRMLNSGPGLNHFQAFTQETRQMTASDVLSTEGLQSGILEQMRAWAFVKTSLNSPLPQFPTIRKKLCVPARGVGGGGRSIAWCTEPSSAGKGAQVALEQPQNS